MFLRPPAMTSVLLCLTSGLLLQLLFETGEAKTCRLVSCERRMKMESHGYGIISSPDSTVEIDVGECGEVYESSQDCELPGSDQVPLQEGSGEPQQETCLRRCEPRSYSRIHASNREAPFTVFSIKSCYGTRHHCLKECVRKPNYVYMFPGSKYQQRIDVGKCVGQCTDNPNNSPLECVASRVRYAAFNGPNGFETMPIVEECSCKNTLCYRVDHFQSFSELVVNQNNNTTVQKKRRERLINIGKCIGSCPGVKIPGTCYPSDDDCVFYLGERNAYCVPTAGESHTYTDLNGIEQSVEAIKECGCSTG